MGFDRDPALFLEIHRVEQLFLHVAGCDRARAMQQSVRKRGLPMINMGNNAEISYVRCVHFSKMREQVMASPA